MLSTKVSILFILAITETLALHIVISPDEAAKLIKRDDEFSKGLAGFIDGKISKPKHIKVTKREKIDELKSMIQQLINEADVAKTNGNQEKKDGGNPPALPLDAQTKEISDLKAMVSNLLQEVRSKRKREQDGWVHFGKKSVDMKEQRRPVKSSDAELEQLYAKVKKMVNAEKSKDDRAENTVSEETIISDSGIAKKDVKESKAKDPDADLILKLDSLTNQLTKKADVTSADIGEMSLNAIKKMIAEKRQNSADVKGPETKGHPRSKAKDHQVSLDSLMNEVKELLRKHKPKAGKSGEKHSNEAMKEEIAIEASDEKPASRKNDRRRELLSKILKTYDALIKDSSPKSDDVADELESLSKSLKKKEDRKTGKVSKETARALEGFEFETKGKKKRSSHPK